ncbi:glycerol kinase GlpK [Rhodopirellula sp. MGV]|uniref:glycerol kinase GlpK n=1 Tax=Rhodopirellula sp. MGV TaxID=2023130 RepID=UPI000B9623A1|nr:glycerol kinase GlpK [Rhodopirellula sp. MGV]OYP34152.1 glycerol kinase [Rhodopirellula sp. MGV]PNY33588.1 glycerol kinase [Rhodopirellula baltica]
MGFIVALDQGTTSSRAIAVDENGHICGIEQQEFKQHFPKSGWVEHDANEIWQSQLDVTRKLLDRLKIDASQIAGIGLTNQRETTLLWDRKTGQPIHNAIVWQDRRTSPECQRLIADGANEIVQDKTGLLIDPYFCGTKIGWLLDNVSGARARAERGELAFGTIDSWLIWNLTGGRLHMTDITNASRTMLMNLHTGSWDDELLELFKIPRELLPQIRPACSVYDETDSELFGGVIKIAGAAGDQQSALFGQNCSRPGMAKNTYGTGCFMLMNLGDQPQASRHKLLTTVAASPNASLSYAFEGSVFIAGAAVQWLRDGLGIIESSSDIEDLAATVEDTDGVYLVPAFSGLGAPQWDSEARGTIVGLTRGTTKAHLARATLEGIAFQVADVLDAMQNDAGESIHELRVDGGAAQNNLLMQFQADIMQTPVVRPKITETTAMGAAYLAGLATGFFPSIDSIESVWEVERRFEPSMKQSEVEYRRERWAEALRRSQHWERTNA